jgi:putative ABC transport system ATP-binding protein
MVSSSAARPTLLQIRGLHKGYTEAERSRVILDHVDLEIEVGEFFVILGKSGSGKSTLLNLISGIDNADQGDIYIDGLETTRLSETEMTRFRRRHIGIVFQFFNLIPTLTILENITLPLELMGMPLREAQQRARPLLARIGLDSRSADFPDKLSGGEQQRVALARALVHEPALVLADEPTGNLDEETGHTIMALLLELTREAGRTLIMATHNPEIVPLADRVCRIHDGKLMITSQRTARQVMPPEEALVGV